MSTTKNTIPAITLNDGHVIPQLGCGTLALQPDRESTEDNARLTAAVVSQALVRWTVALTAASAPTPTAMKASDPWRLLSVQRLTVTV